MSLTRGVLKIEKSGGYEGDHTEDHTSVKLKGENHGGKAIKQNAAFQKQFINLIKKQKA